MKMSSLVFVVMLLVGEISLLSNAQTFYPKRRPDPCGGTVCENGGTCVFPLDYPICQCLSGFGGRRCENIVQVKPGSCANSQNAEEGTCDRTCDNDYDCPGTRKCCPTFCERMCTDRVIRDPCSSFCLNSGICRTTFPGNVPKCQCPPGYTGERCEANVSPRPGACPTIRPGDFGLCGARSFCKTDTECFWGQKCCPSTCGGLCTPVA